MANQPSAACGAMLTPTSARTMGDKASMMTPGKMPASRHSTLRAPMATSEKRSTSCASFAASLRGRPKKPMPKARTKQAPASAAASASRAPTAGISSFSAHDGSDGLSRIAWNTSHSEAKPLSGGSAEMAAQPTSTNRPVAGMRFSRPPSFPRSRSPVAASTAPAPKNSRFLNSAWFSTWNSAAVIASAAAAPKSLVLKASARPSATKMTPMFSMVE